MKEPPAAARLTVWPLKSTAIPISGTDSLRAACKLLTDSKNDTAIRVRLVVGHGGDPERATSVVRRVAEEYEAASGTHADQDHLFCTLMRRSDDT
jgi:hypothetical protein